MKSLNFSLKKFNNRKRILLIISILLVYCLLVIGSTYAYLHASSINNNTITGDLGTASIELSVEKVIPTQEAPLVPLTDAALVNAIKGTGGKSSCIDSNNNLSCEIYKITISNTGTTNLILASTINLVSGSDYTDYYENLKWRELSDLTTVKTDSVVNGMSSSTLDGELNLAVNQTKNYYIAVWISETGSNQLTEDYGSYGGIVKFFSRSGAGVTAVFGETPNLFTQEVQSLYHDGTQLETVTLGPNSSTETVGLMSDTTLLRYF